MGWGACREILSGKFHWNRYFMSAARCPVRSSGYTATLSLRFVRVSVLVSEPPKHPAYTTAGSVGSTAMCPLSQPPTAVKLTPPYVGGSKLWIATVLLSCWAPYTRYG